MTIDQNPQNEPTPLLRLSAISKSFGGTYANEDIHLSVYAGEIHALLGENGAGKSTLVKMIYGILSPDEGQIYMDGKAVSISSPSQARKMGIGMVFQHFSLFDSLSVAENISLAIDEKHDIKELSARIEEVSAKYGLPLKADAVVYTLSTCHKQRVEIVRCLLQNPKLLIMDEPTAVLSQAETGELFATLKQLADEGCAILYISHKLDEIREICHKATILRAGKYITEVVPQNESNESLARLMVGNDFDTELKPQADTGHHETLLQIKNLHLDSPLPFGTNLKHIDLDVKAGEIVGIAGISGNGQQELLASISGEYLNADKNAIRIMGQSVGNIGPKRRRNLGFAYVPEDRLGHGTVPSMSLNDNSLLSGYARRNLTKHGLLRRKRIQAYAQKVIKMFNVKTKDRFSEAQSLSGGNLQKFIIGREIMQNPKVLVAAQPTWGVDRASQAAIHQALIQLRNQGSAILILSQDLHELFAISDKIGVLFEGSLSVLKETRQINPNAIGVLMSGVIEENPQESLAEEEQS
ncbi:MAG: ABC transporter ATP-binding protein [Alphaproteobacteria bacterium]